MTASRWPASAMRPRNGRRQAIARWRRWLASLGDDNLLCHAQRHVGLALPDWIRQEVGDRWGVAFALQWLASSYMAHGERTAVLAAAEQSLAGFRRLGNPWGAGMTPGALANLKLQAGELAAARQLAEEGQALRKQVGHRHSLGVGLDLLARIALQERKLDEAATFYREAILLFESLGNRPYADELRAAVGAIEAARSSTGALP